MEKSASVINPRPSRRTVQGAGGGNVSFTISLASRDATTGKRHHQPIADGFRGLGLHQPKEDSHTRTVSI